MIYYEDRDFLIERLDYRGKGYYIMFNKRGSEIDFVVDMLVNTLEEWIAFGKRLANIEREQEKRAIKEGMILQSRGE